MTWTKLSASSPTFRFARPSVPRHLSSRPFAIATQPLKASTMPRLRLTLPGRQIPWTRTPNALLDILMPSLKDTELRVLLVLLRQTVGWNKDGQTVILRYRTLQDRTGRQSEAISKALDSLSARGLIHMRKVERTRPFRSPNKRSSPSEEQQ